MKEYRKLVPLLSDNGKHTVVSVDLRGMGESDVNFKSYEPEDTGHDLISLIAELKRTNVVLVGCSMSAASVVFASAEYNVPSSIRAAIFISPFIWDHAMPFGVPTLLSLLVTSFTGAWFWTDYYKTLYTLKSQPVDDLEPYCAQLAKNLKEKGRISALRGHLFGSKASCDQKCQVIAARELPVFAIYGEKDPDFASHGLEVEKEGLKKRFPYIAQPLIVPGCVRMSSSLLWLRRPYSSF